MSTRLGGPGTDSTWAPESGGGVGGLVLPETLMPPTSDVPGDDGLVTGGWFIIKAQPRMRGTSW
jgi:hypothetical protein